MKKIFQQYRPIIILVCEMIIFSLINDRFLTASNLTNVMKQVCINAILAAAVSFPILLGGIDISIGAVVGFVGAVCASLVIKEVPLAGVILIALAIGALAGAFNGFFIAKCDLQPMIVTLASMSIFRGATLVYSDGVTVAMNKGCVADSFKYIGGGSVLGIPIPVIIMLVVYLIVYYIQNKTAFGRHIYAVGGNEEATYLSGINVKLTKFICYVICGILSAVAGIVLVARVGSAQPTAGNSYEMDAIAACVVGGTSLRGGEGFIWMTLVGAIIIGMMNNILNLMNVSSYWQTIVKGVVILAAVLLDSFRDEN